MEWLIYLGIATGIAAALLYAAGGVIVLSRLKVPVFGAPEEPSVDPYTETSLFPFIVFMTRWALWPAIARHYSGEKTTKAKAS